MLFFLALMTNEPSFDVCVTLAPSFEVITAPESGTSSTFTTTDFTVISATLFLFCAYPSCMANNIATQDINTVFMIIFIFIISKV